MRTCCFMIACVALSASCSRQASLDSFSFEDLPASVRDNFSAHKAQVVSVSRLGSERHEALWAIEYWPSLGLIEHDVVLIDSLGKVVANHRLQSTGDARE